MTTADQEALRVLLLCYRCAILLTAVADGFRYPGLTDAAPMTATPPGETGE